MLSYKFQKHCCFLFWFLFSLFCFSACSTSEIIRPNEEEIPQYLTGIFSEITCVLPNTVRTNHKVLPYYDIKNGTITEFMLEREEIMAEDGTFGEALTAWLYTFSLDGRTIRKEELPLPAEITSVQGGAVLEDAVYCLRTRRTEGVTVYRTDRTTKEITVSDNLRELTGMKEFTPNFFTLDKNGRIYTTDGDTVCILNPDLTFVCSLDFPTTVYRMARGADGEVWVTFNAGMESCAAKIDADRRELSTYHIFRRGTENSEQPLHDLLNSPVSGSAYNFYYYDQINTIWGVIVGEDGTLTEEAVADLFNSGVSRLYNGETASAGLYFTAIHADDLFITTRYTDMNWADRDDSIVLFRKTKDIDLRDVFMISIAYAYSLDTATVERITEYKRTHPNVMIALEDYSIYATEEDSRAGEKKLCFDLVNGFIEPDIVVTRASENLVRDDMLTIQLVEKNLYVDLTPYLENDDTVNFDTLFGCIPRLFDDGNGGMWGITSDFTFGTLLGSTEFLGEYADQTSWTLTEMLDYFDSFPEDTEEYYLYTLKQKWWTLLADGYSYFIDDDTCSFDSAEFLRYLAFLKTIPATLEEWKQTSPCADIYSLSFSEQDKARDTALSAGKIALDRYGLQYYNYDAFFTLLSGEFYPIGYASDKDSGVRIGTSQAYIITTLSENPDTCFDIIKSFFIGKDLQQKSVENWPLFALKPQFRQAMVIYTTSDTDIMSEDELKSLYEQNNFPYTPYEQPQPLTEEELTRLYDIFDNAGIPMLERTPAAMEEIVNEEISAYLAGMGTAEDCAIKIQSRVGIWLAEHD